MLKPDDKKEVPIKDRIINDVSSAMPSNAADAAILAGKSAAATADSVGESLGGAIFNLIHPD